MLDLDFVRSQFPAFASPLNADQSFFENAGGSYACRQTIDALHRFYTETKVQPYAGYEPSRAGGVAMDRSRQRWAESLGVAPREVVFGPSTSMNTYVLAAALAEVVGPGDEIVVTNQDHEANTGAVRRMAARVGATLVEWRIDPATGELDVDQLASLLTPHTRLVTMPHASNIVGQENDVARVCTLAHAVGAHVIVDAVAYAPHSIADVAALDADVYLFSLYKTFSVHQGLMVVRNGLLDELPNQGHFFNAEFADKRLNPAGPDHAQVAGASGVLDYVAALDEHHGNPAGDDLATIARRVSARWRDHEASISAPLLAALADRDDVRLIGPRMIDGTGGHRCPTIAFSPMAIEPEVVARGLVERGVQTNSGHFYAYRVLEALDLDPERGVVRLSSVHYTSPADIERAITALDEVLA